MDGIMANATNDREKQEEPSMKMAKRMVTALLALVMALSLASCSDTSWVVKSGDETISAGVYLSYLFDAYYLYRPGSFGCVR